VQSNPTRILGTAVWMGQERNAPVWTLVNGLWILALDIFLPIARLNLIVEEPRIVASAFFRGLSWIADKEPSASARISRKMRLVGSIVARSKVNAGQVNCADFECEYR
jgi:hypothetical protein